nr:PREDICTED: putative L-ascorbate peroxidase 6 isoform X3 [Musa acuminata subsp. malaccensis]
MFYALGSDMRKIVASSGRRRLILTVLIPIMFTQHHIAKAVDVGEASILQNGVRNFMSKAKAAGLLRLAFHDAGTFDLDDKSGGMNGSIVYELDRPENAGLNKSLKVLEKAKMEIEKIQQVSWADLIAVAGAEAVSLCGGPVIPVQLGRLDARTPDPQGKLPQETLDASGLKKCFLKKGFSGIMLTGHRNLLHYLEHIQLETKVLEVLLFLTMLTSIYYSKKHGHLQVACRA